MTDKRVTTEIARLDDSFVWLVLLNERFIGEVEISVTREITAFKEREEMRVASTVPALTSLLVDLYFDAEYHIMRAYFSPNPGFFAVLAGIWGVIVAVWQGISFVIDFLKIKEILAVANILSIIWPAFREKMNAVYGKIAEFSQQIGWGADGFMHLIQAAQGGVDLLGGLLKKDANWLEIKMADKAVTALRFVTAYTDKISTDPAIFLDAVFSTSQRDNLQETKNWWYKTSLFIEAASERATKAITQIDEVIGEFQEAQNKLPAFIRDNIPSEIWDGLDWANSKIDGTLLPALSQLNKTISEVNAVMAAQREAVKGMLDELKHPGDIKARLEALTGTAREINEANLDSAAGSLFDKQTAGYEEYDAEIMDQLDSILAAMSAPIPEPVFLSLEGAIRNEIPRPAGSGVETWFVGDF